MELSSKSEYALLALLHLADRYQDDEPLQIRQIAADQDIPDRYLEQLLATLRRGGLVKSQRGAKGGYLLSRAPWAISLLDVLRCLEGADANVTDNNGSDRNLESVIIYEIWVEVDQAANDVLQRYTLQDLKDRRDARQQLDLMYYI
ncbi:MAG TPA: Rrf2 family transcriptional regulator [Coleofasciculaceae cyanobacterium]